MARKRGPNSPARKPDVAAIHAQLQAAVALHRQGKLADAAASYEAVLKSQPDNFDGLNLLGMALRQSGRPEPAVKLIAKAIAINPGNAAAHINLGIGPQAISWTAGRGSRQL